MKVVKEKISFMFPGQGFQFVGMLNDFVYPGSRKYSDVIQIFDKSLKSEIGGNISTLMTLENTDSDSIAKSKRMRLNETKIAQPAILLHSLLNFEKFKESENNQYNYEISYLFGPSLGEIISLVVAGSITYEEGANVLYNRGKFMQESCPIGLGTMLNVIGDKDSIIEHFDKFKMNNLNQEEREYIDISSINSKRLAVLSGKTELIEKSIKFFKENSIACKKLPVSAAFHSKLMENAQILFNNYLNNTSNIIFKPPKYPILSTVENSNLQFYQEYSSRPNFDSEVKSLLVKQLRYPVNLLDSVKYNSDNNIKIYDMNKRKFIDPNEYI